MNADIYRKEISRHGRIRKNIIFVITSRFDIAVSCLYEELHVTHKAVTIRVINSSKAGKALLKALKQYFKDSDIKLEDGDKVYLYDERKWLNWM